MKQKNTIWQRIWDTVCILAGAIFVTLGLLALVFLFEKLEIDVPGSREMWIGLIGAILGGAYTLLGVQITIRKQESEHSYMLCSLVIPKLQNCIGMTVDSG